jgi:hypothetical protein
MPAPKCLLKTGNAKPPFENGLIDFWQQQLQPPCVTVIDRRKQLVARPFARERVGFFVQKLF